MFIYVVLCSLVLLIGCSKERAQHESNEESAKGEINVKTSSESSFAYDSMLKFENNIYVGTKEGIKNIGEQIGEVEVFSTNETDKSKNTTFSNRYPKGTKLYRVIGERVENVIAVQLGSNSYIKAYSLKFKAPGAK